MAFWGSSCRHPVSPNATFLQIKEEMRKGHLDAAQQHVDRAISRYEGGKPDWAARFRVQKAHVLLLQGSYGAALQLTRQPLPASLQRTDTQVQRKMVEALAEDFLQQFESAEKAVGESERLASEIHSPMLGDVAQAKGTIALSQGNYASAAAAFHTVLDLARQENDRFKEILATGSLGNVAMGQEHFDQAIDWFRMALEKAQSVHSLSSESKAFGNMGWNYSVVGDFENAEISFKAAGAKAAQAGLVEDATYWLNSLASVYFQQHRYSDGETTARAALAEARRHDDKNTLTTCLNTSSEIALATGRLDDAQAFNREAAEIENSGQDQSGINATQLLSGRIATAKQRYPEALAHFQAVLADPKAETAQKWEAHARQAELYAAERQPAKAENQFNIAIRTVRAARSSIQDNEFRVSFLSSAIEFYDAYVNFLIDQRRPEDALQIADLSRSESFDDSQPQPNGGATRIPLSRAFRPQNTARRLHSTLLFYWLGERRSWLWVVSSAKTVLVPLPPGAGIDAPVRSYRQAFLDPRDPLEAGNADGRKLYEMLAQPAQEFIAQDSRVVVFPDGSLNSLNFETLIAPGCSESCGKTRPITRPHYWIDDVTITTANSLSRLAGSSIPAPPRNPAILIVGKSLPASPDFPPIAQAGVEIGHLEGYFPADRRLELTGGKATPRGYLSSQPERFSYLHFTAHGTASRLQPLESAIILSPEGDSFKLYARDILKRPLSAYLVTISACNGNGVKTYAGEGLVGLSWAFLRAGARHVIGGLWEVSNASTPQLMDEMYKNLTLGQDPAAALRKAKLTLVHSSDNYRRPFYWAPFLVYSGS
jgi:CHAT domain-containing protein